MPISSVSSKEELMSMQIAEMSQVIDGIAAKLVNKLLELVDQYVYDAYDPPEYGYERQEDNGGLRGSYVKTDKPTIVGNTISSEIFSDVSTLTLDEDRYIHGSHYGRNGDMYSDIRAVLDEIIIEGLSGPLFNFSENRDYWLKPRDYWQPFIKLLDDGEIDKLIEEEFGMRGISYSRM
jgi:hypothetical protein